MTTRDQSAPVAVFDRMSTILDTFDGSGPLTLGQVVRRCGLPRSSVHRMLEQLVAKRWLHRVDQEYELGIRLFELGSTAVQQNRLYAGSAPLLSELHRISGMVVHLGILDKTDVVYLSKVGGPYASAVPTRVGGRRPAHETALGRALLAFGEASSCASSWPRLLQNSIRKIQDTGVAYEPGETVTGLNCIAAPIGPPADAVAAISICGPAGSLRLDHQSAVPVLIAAAAIWEVVSRGTRTHELARSIRTLHSMPTASGVWTTQRAAGNLAR